MKLKKLIKVINPHQPIRFSARIGSVTRHCEVFRLDDKYYQPYVDSLGDCKVVSITNIYDPSQLPDFNYYIEITLKGGNDNDNN